MITRLFIAACVFLSTATNAQTTVDAAISKGNLFYKEEQFDLAEKQYRAALAQNSAHAITQYNLANALIKQKRYDEAKRLLETITKNEEDKNIKAAAFYNNGVVYTKQKNLDASIEAYKGALRINPDDKEARENLQKALLEKKKEEQQKQQQQRKQNQSSMSRREADQKLKSLQEKEKRIQERLQNKGQKGTALPKDW